MVIRILETLLLLFGTSALSAQSASMPIQTIESIDQAQEELLEADQQTLVVFDIDGTLIDNFGLGVFILYNPQKVPEEDKDFAIKAHGELSAYAKKIGIDRRRDMTNSFFMLKGKEELVEPAVLEQLVQLKAKKIKTIALTACPAGAFGSVSCGETLRYSKLLSAGIDFRPSFPQEQIVFDTLNAYNGSYPMFYKGILLANWRNEKGAVLGAFFDCIGWQPRKVIFFDDTKRHLESVSDEMDRRGILFQGYWYRAAERHALPAFDRAIAEVQLDYLIHHDTLLTAAEASAFRSTKSRSSLKPKLLPTH